MTASILVGPEDVSGSVTLEGLVSVTTSADGAPGDSGIVIDDPGKVYAFKPWETVQVIETACSQPRCFTGSVLNLHNRRENFRVNGDRVWDIDVVDLNELLHRRVLRGSGAKRPSETGSERLDWLMTTAGVAGIVFDNGKIMANAWQYDEADYRGQYADEVLQSIISASAANRWTFFVYWDPDASSGEEVSLFYGDTTSTLFDSTLLLSNVLSEIDDIDDPSALVFAAHLDTELESVGEDIYDGVYIDWPGGQTYLQRPSTFAEFGIHRDGILDSTRINNSTTAERHANTFLDIHSGKVDTITCTVRLPASKVNLIDAGMRVQVYFEHLPGYDDPDYTWVRVSRRTITFTTGTNKYYDCRLELSARGISQTGGGSPGDFPSPPPQPALHYFESTVSYMSDGYGSSGGSGVTAPGTNTTTSVIGDVVFTGPVGDYTYHADMTIDPADLSTGHQWGVAEDDGSGAWGPLHVNVGGPGTTVTFDGTFSVTGSDFTGWLTASVNAASHIPKATTIYAYIDPVDWETGEGAIPPAPGQWVYGEVVAMSGDTGTTTWPYADGSLVIRVDGVPISRASYTEDGATGDFTLSWTPDSDEVVTVDYQGR